VITLEFAVPTALAVALVIALSIGAVYLADKYLLPVNQLKRITPSSAAENSSPAEASPTLPFLQEAMLGGVPRHEGEIGPAKPYNSRWVGALPA
jgi:hypothetical protein